jgi:hypothetical protein
MKKLIPILLAVFALASCEKDPDMGKLDDNYLVYTNYDKKADFKVPTFYLAPQILVISDSKEPEYLEGEGAEQILAAYTDNMVLQRDVPLTVQGIANAGDRVTVSIADRQMKTKAGLNGKWSVTLPPLKVSK